MQPLGALRPPQRQLLIAGFTAPGSLFRFHYNNSPLRHFDAVNTLASSSVSSVRLSVRLSICLLVRLSFTVALIFYRFEVSLKNFSCH